MSSTHLVFIHGKSEVLMHMVLLRLENYCPEILSYEKYLRNFDSNLSMTIPGWGKFSNSNVSVLYLLLHPWYCVIYFEN